MHCRSFLFIFILGQDCLAENPLIYLEDLEYNVSELHMSVKSLYSSLDTDLLPTLIIACGDDNNILATNATLHSVGTFLSIQ